MDIFLEVIASPVNPCSDSGDSGDRYHYGVLTRIKSQSTVLVSQSSTLGYFIMVKTALPYDFISPIFSALDKERNLNLHNRKNEVVVEPTEDLGFSVARLHFARSPN